MDTGEASLMENNETNTFKKKDTAKVLFWSEAQTITEEDIKALERFIIGVDLAQKGGDTQTNLNRKVKEQRASNGEPLC